METKLCAGLEVLCEIFRCCSRCARAQSTKNIANKDLRGGVGNISSVSAEKFFLWHKQASELSIDCADICGLLCYRLKSGITFMWMLMVDKKKVSKTHRISKGVYLRFLDVSREFETPTLKST